jgi:16S rRNA (guanine527-N7)-methyltransferase
VETKETPAGTSFLSRPLLDRLETDAYALGVPLDARRLAAFSRFAGLLVAWADRLNLTRLIEPEEIVHGHFLDSLVCLFADRFPPAARVIDVGSGAGFPGIPLKIARADLTVTLLDASRRRVAFLETATGELGLDVEVLHGRAEDVGRREGRFQAYDRVVSRATAPLDRLIPLCVPLMTVGGRGVFPKGPRVHQEVDAAGPALSAHGAKVVSVVQSPGQRPGSGDAARGPRHVVVVEARHFT